MNKKPNILFLMSDEHRADVLGFAGNDIVRTPVLDRLAEDAVIFDNCYTPSPICIPGRQAMMAGQLPKTCGCLKFSDDLPGDYMTFSKRFSQYAYQTAVCGKLHHHGPDMYQGWNLRVGWDNGKSGSVIEGRVEEEFEKYKPKHSQWWPWAKEVQRAGVGKSPHQIKDEYAVAGALALIDEYFASPVYDQERSSQPLMLKVSLRLPHYPFFTDEEKFTYYLNRVKPYFREPTFDHPVVTRDWDTIGDEVTEREVRRATAAYYGMIETMDSMYGQVIDKLEQVGEDIDDWIIIYTTDHGEMLGEHGIWTKFKYYEASAGVPLFIRWPKKFQPKRVDSNTSIVDLFATLCELCDIPAPEGLDSRSLVPLMNGHDSDWNNEAISQLDDTCMIKRDHLKYQWLGEGHKEILFDLSKNPGETVNFIDDPNYADDLDYFRCRLKMLGY